MSAPVYPLLFAALVAIAWSAPAAAHPAPPALRAHCGVQVGSRALRPAARHQARLELRCLRSAWRVERRLHWAHHRHAARHPRA